MNEYVISFETAKLANEKGFTEYTEFVYLLKDLSAEYGIGKFCKSLEGDSNDGLIHGVEVSAPPQSLLQKWLREKHGIIVLVEIRHEPYYDLSIRFNWVISIPKENTYNLKKALTDVTYEEALEQGLQKALELI